VYEEGGYLLDPHSAIAYLGLKEHAHGAPGIFLATAHPAKFIEIVGPIIGLTMSQRQQITPEPLAHALAQPRRLMPLVGALDAVKAVING
jgi:threonine synthase